MSVLFGELLCLIGPVLVGRDYAWATWLWLVMLLGTLVIAAFLCLKRPY